VSNWGGSGGKAAKAGAAVVEADAPTYDAAYYAEQFNKRRTAQPRTRMALVAKENCGKTGLALWLSRTEKDIKDGKKVYIFDFDNSADQTVDHACPGDDNVFILNIFDETDDSIFHEDMSVNWLALIDKTQHFVNLIAKEVETDPKGIGAIIFDGGSTFMKWCEFAMLESLKRKGIINDEGDSFNQKEWRERNRLFRDTITRVHGLNVAKVFFTFHLKDHKQYADLGNGQKGLMKIGEKADWVDGTQRLWAQQIWLGRFQKKGDAAAGVQSDKSLADDEWVIRAEVQEIKGRGMDLLGSEHTILTVKGGKVDWKGIPALRW
jgi:hypothetical protein